MTIAQQTGQTPTFRSRVDLVQIYAAVRDAAGNPVKGLRAEDFSVFDNDRRVSLEVVAEFAGTVVEGPAWSRERSVNVATNDPIEDKRLVVIVLDDARMSLFGWWRTRLLDIGRQLVRNLAPDDLACVVFTAKNNGAQDFTADKELLLRSVETLGGGFPIVGGPPVMSAYSVDVLRRVAATLAETPARRKMLVFVGAGQNIYVLPPNTSKPVMAERPGSRTGTDDFGVAGRVDAVLKAAQKTGMAVYAIDPRPEVSVQGQRSPMTLFLKDIAKHTGATAVVGEPDPAKAALSVLTDADHYYVLGFRAGDDVRPGMFRKLRVTVSRPELSVRSQTGYYPPKTIVGDEIFPDLKGAPTTAALAGALPTGALPLQLALTPLANRPDARRGIPGQIAVTVQTGRPDGASGRLSGPVQMELRVFDGEGRREVANITDRRAILALGLVNPIPVIQIGPGRYNVRVALQHVASGTTASVYGTVTVPDYSKDALSASGIFVEVPGATANAWRDGVSSARRTFSQSEAVSLIAGLYASQRPVTAAVKIEILNGRDAVVHRESRNVLVGDPGNEAGTEVRVPLPLNDLPPGPYLLRMSITAGKTSLNRDFVFHVAPNEVPFPVSLPRFTSDF